MVQNYMFRLEDHYTGSKTSRPPAVITVYDYYRPGKYEFLFNFLFYKIF